MSGRPAPKWGVRRPLLWQGARTPAVSLKAGQPSPRTRAVPLDVEGRRNSRVGKLYLKTGRRTLLAFSWLNFLSLPNHPSVFESSGFLLWM